MSEEEIIKFLSCDNCKSAACEQCEINQTTKKAILNLITKQQKQIERFNKVRKIIGGIVWEK